MSEVESVIKDLKSDKKFKDVMISKGSNPDLVIKKLPFEVPMLDNLLGGGLPIGKYTLIYGSYSVGKTFLIQKIISSTQKKCIRLAYIDVDKSYEPSWWSIVGVDIDNLIVAQPNTGEQVFDLALHLVESKFGLVIIDSLDLVVPTAEVEADFGNQTMNLSLSRAKLISTGLRKIKAVNTDTTLVCANHISEGIGAFSQWKIPGGRAQEDFASVMMWISRGANIKESEVKKNGAEDKRVGFNIKVMLEKDKIMGRRYDSCQLPFIFEGGIIDDVSGLFEICLSLGIIKKSKSTYAFLDQNIFGKLNVKEYLSNNPEVQEELKKQVRKIEKYY